MEPTCPSLTKHADRAFDVRLYLTDLLNPTARSESVLEKLTAEQLAVIEQTLCKIREKKSSTDKFPSPLLTPDSLRGVSPSKMAAPAMNATQSNAYQCDTTQSPATRWNAMATHLAEALATALSCGDDDPSPSSGAKPHHTKTFTNAQGKQRQAVDQGQEPCTEIRDGIEYVSFVYSHHRVLRRYSIRTDVESVDVVGLDDKFRSENCVYPRANLPRELYRGNRWAYETECNQLGWKLAYRNPEIAGKRGLIQRAVDSYRNRYPSMRSRRVARQEKLLKGQLRKRKHRDETTPMPQDDSLRQPDELDNSPDNKNDNTPGRLTKIPKTDKYQPKTIMMDDANGLKYRIRINIESVQLGDIDTSFRKSNCVFPRAHDETSASDTLSRRRLDEARCNELGWKLAWLNPHQLANKKNMLQKALDLFRSKFIPDLLPRKYASRLPPFSPPVMQVMSTPLTEEALRQHQTPNSLSGGADDDNESIYSGTTASLDYLECFSPPESPTPSNFLASPMTDTPDLSPTSGSPDTNPGSGPFSLFVEPREDLACHLSVASCSTTSDEDAPVQESLLGLLDVEEMMDEQSLIGDSHAALFDLYADGLTQEQAVLKPEDIEYDPLMSYDNYYSSQQMNNPFDTFFVQ